MPVFAVEPCRPVAQGQFLEKKFDFVSAKITVCHWLECAWQDSEELGRNFLVKGEGGDGMPQICCLKPYFSEW